MKTCKRKKSYPEWAKFKATDADGLTYIYGLKPSINEFLSEWIVNRPYRYVKINYDYTGDWTKSLRRIKEQ